MGSMANYLGEKYQEYDMNNKIISGGAATLKGLAAAGKFLFKLTKPVVKYASIRTVQGVGYLCKKAEEQINDIDEKEEDEKETTQKDNADDNKKNKNETKEDNTNSNDNTHNTIKNSFTIFESNNNNITEGSKINESCDYPTLNSINMAINDNNNNICPNQNNNCYPNQNNNFYQYQNPNPNNNNNIKPDFVIPVGLEKSGHESSIVGEK
jgi:hypothetical protein